MTWDLSQPGSVRLLLLMELEIRIEKAVVVYLLTALIGVLLWFLGEVEPDFVAAAERQS